MATSRKGAGNWCGSLRGMQEPPRPQQSLPCSELSWLLGRAAHGKGEASLHQGRNPRIGSAPQSAKTAPGRDPAAPSTPSPAGTTSPTPVPLLDSRRPAAGKAFRAVEHGHPGSSGHSVLRVHDGFIAQSNAKATLNYHEFIAQMFLIFKNINITAKLELSKMLKLFQYITSDLSFPDKANIPLSSPQSIYYGNNLSLGRDSHLAQRSEQ